MDEKSDSAPGGPKVLEKSLRILDVFTLERPTWTLSEIARELDLPTPTAHRILRALEHRSYLAKNDLRYQLGFAAVDLGRRAVASVSLRARLDPLLRELAQATGETALLAAYDEKQKGSRCIDRIETTHDLRLSIEVGRVTPLHAGASAKALLAYLDEPIRDGVLAHPLERLAPGTIVNRKRLEAELTEIRARGYASSYEENNVGAWGLAAPILVAGSVVASIGFAAPTARHSDSAERSLAKLVCRVASESEAKLGPSSS